MNIHTEKKTTQEKNEYFSGNYSIIVIIKSVVTIIYIKEEFECIREQFEYTNWILMYLTD